MDSTNTLPQISVSSSQKEVVANQNFANASPAMIFGHNDQTTSGLVWGYLGGRVNGTLVANGTVTATASNTNYVVVNRATFVVSIATTTTNWNDSSTYARCYKLTAGSSTITAYEDWRFNTDGTGLTLAGSGDMLLGTVQIVTAKKTFGAAGAVGKFALAGTTSGSTILDATPIAGSGTVTLPTTGTLATLAGSETLTNKTLTSPVLTTPDLGTPSAAVLTNATGLPATSLTGTIAAARMPAFTGDITTSAGAVATTLATVNANVGSFTNANFTVNAKGLVTAASNGTGGGGGGAGLAIVMSLLFGG